MRRATGLRRAQGTGGLLTTVCPRWTGFCRKVVKVPEGPHVLCYPGEGWTRVRMEVPNTNLLSPFVR